MKFLVSAVPDVKDEVLDLLTVSFVDGGVKLRAKLRFLGALLKGLRDDQAQSNPVGILATVVILRFKRHAVLLLPIADPADEHGAVVGFVPPAGTFMDRAPHGRHFPAPSSFVAPAFEDSKHFDNLLKVLG